jgi:hypothetical protein
LGIERRFERHTGRWLGEFATIVLGVLLALAVDDYRQSREDRGIEAHLISGIRSDVDRDMDDMRASIEAAETRAVAADEILAMIGDLDAGVIRSPMGEELDRNLEQSWERFPDHTFEASAALMMLGSLRRFDVSDATFSEAIASGRWNVVRDENIRAAVSTYYLSTRQSGVTNDERVEAQFQRFVSVLAEAGLAPTTAGVRDAAVLDAFGSRPELIAELKNLRELALRQAQYHRDLQTEAMSITEVLDLWLSRER